MGVMRAQIFMSQAADQGVLLVSLGTIAHLGELRLSYNLCISWSICSLPYIVLLNWKLYMP